MDLATSLIGLGMVALIMLPILYFHYAQKNKRKKFLNDFISQAEQQQLKVSQHDVWSQYSAIGLDAAANKLFFYSKRGDQEQKSLINLAEVEKCRVNISRIAQNEDQVIDRLELVLTIRNVRSSEKVIEFFSKEEFMTLNGELQLVEKWKTIVNSQLEGRRRLSVAV